MDDVQIFDSVAAEFPRRSLHDAVPKIIEHMVRTPLSALPSDAPGAFGAPLMRLPVLSKDHLNYVSLHPVFSLTEHFRSHDDYGKGFTQNPYRGDHMTIPCYTEEGQLVLLEVSFHKGATYVEALTFPGTDTVLISNTIRRAETR